MLLFLRPFFFLCRVTGWMQVLLQRCCTFIKSEESLETHLQKNKKKRKEGKKERMVNTAATQTGMSCSEGAGSFSSHPEASTLFFGFVLRLRTRNNKSIMRVSSNCKSSLAILLQEVELPLLQWGRYGATSRLYPSFPGRNGKTGTCWKPLSKTADPFSRHKSKACLRLISIMYDMLTARI